MKQKKSLRRIANMQEGQRYRLEQKVCFPRKINYLDAIFRTSILDDDLT